MFNTVNVEIYFTEMLCGSVPLSKEIIPDWLKSRMPTNKPENSRTIEELASEVEGTIQEAEEKVTLGFQQDEKGLFIRGGNIKAHLKDCANQIKDIVKIKNLRSKIANKVFVSEYRVYLKDEQGNFIQKSSGDFEQPVHVITPLGPRNALKKIQYINSPKMKFSLQILEDKEIDIELIKKIFIYGSIHGFGGERGMGEGRYSVAAFEKCGEVL